MQLVQKVWVITYDMEIAKLSKKNSENVCSENDGTENTENNPKRQNYKEWHKIQDGIK